MVCFAETSFLCAIYCEQDNSAAAVAFLGKLEPGIALSPLVKFEFENGLNFQAGRFQRDRNQGIAPRQKAEALRAFQADVASGFWRVRALDLVETLRIAEDLSARHTEADLNRTLDVLHVATAIEWKAREFLTFDLRQARLARSAGLKTPLRVMV